MWNIAVPPPIELREDNLPTIHSGRLEEHPEANVWPVLSPGSRSALALERFNYSVRRPWHAWRQLKKGKGQRSVSLELVCFILLLLGILYMAAYLTLVGRQQHPVF